MCCQAFTWEIWMPGRQLRRQPLQWGGELQVAWHRETGTIGPSVPRDVRDGLHVLAIYIYL